MNRHSMHRSLLTSACSSETGLVQTACLYHVPVPNGTDTLCEPHGTWTVPFQNRHLDWFKAESRDLPCQNPQWTNKWFLIELRKFFINRSQIGPNPKLKIDLNPNSFFDDSHDEGYESA